VAVTTNTTTRISIYRPRDIFQKYQLNTDLYSILVQYSTIYCIKSGLHLRSIPRIKKEYITHMAVGGTAQLL
jgi:hypothetical protein